jgi:hypothetical protein
MDTLRAYFVGNYWRRTFLRAETVTSFLAALGFFWLITEISSFLFEAWKAQLQALWTYFFSASVAYTLWLRRPIISMCERLSGTDIRIEIRITDIFNVAAAQVISTCTTFDTEVNETLISSRSLQGAFTKKYYNKSEHLDTDLASALQPEKVVSTRESLVGGKRDKYSIGTVARVAPKGKTTYLLAITELNENGVCESSFENVKQALASLWGFVRSKGSYEPLSIPILGTGHGRLNTPRNLVVKEIIKSFIAACGERKVTNKLTIAIAPWDYHEHELDIYELGEFLRYVCRYTEISPNRQGGGTATT